MSLEIVYLSINKYYNYVANEEQKHELEKHKIMGYTFYNSPNVTIFELTPPMRDIVKKIDIKMIYEGHYIQAGNFLFCNYTGNLKFIDNIDMLITAAHELDF